MFGYNAILSSPGFNTTTGAWNAAPSATAAVKSFDLRAANSIAYWTPKFMGASLRAQVGLDENKSATGSVSPLLWSVGANYEWNGLSVAAAFERHEDGFGLDAINASTTAVGVALFGATAPNNTTAASVDDAWKVAAGYELKSPGGATTISAAYEVITLGQDNPRAGALTEYKRGAWQVGLKHRYGNHEVRARYSMAEAGDCTIKGGGTCNTDDFGASDVAVGYAYSFTKAAQGFVYFTRIDNEDKATYSPTVGGRASSPAP